MYIYIYEYISIIYIYICINKWYIYTHDWAVRSFFGHLQLLPSGNTCQLLNMCIYTYIRIYIYTVYIYNKYDLGLRSFLDTSSCYRLEKTCQLLNMVYSEISYEKTYIHICMYIYIYIYTYTWFRATIVFGHLQLLPSKKTCLLLNMVYSEKSNETTYIYIYVYAHIYIYMYMRIYIWFRATNIFGHLQLLPSW